MAEEGGIGIIDRGYRPGDIEPQVREVQLVKRHQHGVVRDPYTIEADATLAEAAAAMLQSRVGTLVVVDGDRKLAGPPDRARRAVRVGRHRPGLGADDAARPAGARTKARSASRTPSA